MLGTSLRGEWKHGNAWVSETSHRLGCLSSTNCNLSQLSSIWHRSNGNVTHNEHTILTELRSLGNHQHGTAHASDAWSALDDLESRTERVARSGESTTDLSVGFATLDDEATVIERVEHLFASLFDGHTFLLAKFKEQLSIFFTLRRSSRVDESGFVDVLQSELVSKGMEFVDVAKNDDVCKSVSDSTVCSSECALLCSFREHDALFVSLSALNDTGD